jgi:capsular polysaccharide transport system permease protein
LTSLATSASGDSLWHSLRVQLRVLGALLMREIVTRYGRQNLGFLWLFFEPMIFTLGITGLWAMSGLRHATALPVVAFAVTGYSAVLLWRNCATRCCMAINPNLGLLYHRNVRVLDLFATRIVLEIAGATMSFVTLSAIWITAGWMELPVDLVPVMMAWCLLAWFGASLALILGSLTAHSRVWERLWGPVAYLLFPLSGAVFMVDWLPLNIQKVILWVPMVHGTEMLRDGFFGPVVRTHYDAQYLATVCIALTLLGLAMSRRAEQLVEFEE